MLATMIHTVQETPSTLPYVLTICLGTLISLIGIFRALKGQSSSTFTFSFGKSSLKMTRLTQGAIIVIIGAWIVIVGLYSLPVRKTEIEKTSTTITRPNGERIETAN